MKSNNDSLLKALVAVVQQSDDIIVVKDLDLRVIATNNTFAKIIGKDDYRELLGKTDAEIFNVSPDMEPIRSYMEDERKAQKLKKGEKITCVEPVILKDGTIRQYYTQKYPIFDGDKLIGTGNISVDVTEEKIYEATIKEQKDEFETLFKEAQNGIAILDLESNFLDFNDAHVDLVGYSKEELLTMSCIGITIKKDVPKVKEAFKVVLKDGYYKNLEKSCVRKDGKLITVNMNISMLPDKKRILISTIDITESTNLKKELLYINETLEKRVQKEVKEKMEKEKLLLKQAKLASMGEMIDAIAHQWLNPISTIRLYTQTNNYLIQDDFEKNKDTVLDHHEKMEAQIDHLVNTLEEFRSFYRPDTESQYISAESLIESTILLMKDELLKKQITYSITVKSDFEIKVIKNQFKHVIMNLISNSKDAFEENNIEKKHIDFELTNDENYNIINYSDNAGGIPENIICKIFDSNFTTKEKGKGTGVGLYLCKQILEKFHLAIDATNNYDGVTFSIKSSK